MEVTTWVEALRWQRAALGGSASTQAATRVNVEQASKKGDAEADPPIFRGRLPASGKRAMRAPGVSAGVLTAACVQEGNRGNTGSPVGGAPAPNRESARTSLGRQGGGEARSSEEAG